VLGARGRDVDPECDLGDCSSLRVSREARRIKLESRCEKRREAYTERVARESPRLDLYLFVNIDEGLE
jgi:hypothetical protein